MSKPNSYIDKILLNPKKYNPYSHMRPAVKDMNFFYKNCITYNMVENLTQFKNKEIPSNDLNIRLFSNLSFLFAKNNINIKANKNKKNQSNKKIQKRLFIKENNSNILDGYEYFIPTKRIPYFNRRPLKDKVLTRRESSRNPKKIHNKEARIKIPKNLRDINFFRPCGRFIVVQTTANSNSGTRLGRKKSSLSVNKSSDAYSDDLSNSIGYSNSNINIDDVNEGNDSLGDYSLIYAGVEDSFFHEKSFINLLKTSTTFPKYAELIDLIECPFEDSLSPEMRLNNYLNILNDFLNDEDYDENINSNATININSNNNTNLNNNINNNINSNINIDINNNITFLSNQESSAINLSNDTTEDSNLNNNISEKNQKIFITNPSYQKLDLSNLEKNKLPRKSSKSGELMKVNSNIFSNRNNASIINKTFLSDENDDGYKAGESIFAFFEDDNDKKNPSKKIDSKIRKILPKSSIKYANKMNNQYIFLMYDKFKLILSDYNEAKNFIHDENTMKKLFIQMLKKFLLNIGIGKKLYEKLVKFETNNKDILNFEHFMNIFELILNEKNKDKENLRFKFLLLLKIICPNDDIDQILDENKMNIFFDLIGCEYVYINNFCEILGERLVLRYKAIYSNESTDKRNIDKNIIYRKIKIILESFLDVLDSQIFY